MQGTLRRLRQKRADGDRGFTLIELLVVVVIIGVLVAIAIPLYLNYRKGAQNKSAQADARNAIIAVEQCYTDNNNTYPASVTGTAGAAISLSCGGTPVVTEKANVSPGNILIYTLVAGNPASYTIKVTQTDTGKAYTYTSSTGIWT